MFRTAPVGDAHSREQLYRSLGRNVEADAFEYAAARHALQLGVYGVDADICDCDGLWHAVGCDGCRNPRRLGAPGNGAAVLVVTPERTTMCNHCGELYDHRTGIGHAWHCTWEPVSHVVSPAAERERLTSPDRDRHLRNGLHRIAYDLGYTGAAEGAAEWLEGALQSDYGLAF